jgi:uracil-DNA glycosylase
LKTQINTQFDWKNLDFWKVGEWDVIQEHLDDLKKAGKIVCPARKNLFRALELVPYSKCKVMWIGQDPYPDPKYATGVAFSIPKEEESRPPTLKAILKEYEDDLHYGTPESGSLERWCEQGVLLWNACPTCEAGHIGSHHGWVEWKLLTEEIIKKLSEKGIVFVFMGSRAKEFDKFVANGSGLNRILYTAHPSPRATYGKEVKNPFVGSRIFSTINGHLNDLALGPIDWRL